MSVIISPKVTGSVSDYDIRINGEKAKPEEAFVSAVPFNRRWPGHQRGLEQTELAWFLNVAADEPLHFEIRPKNPFEHVEIRPRSLGITPEIENGVIRFTLEKPAYFTVEPYGRHHALHLFADPLPEYGVTPETPGVIYYGPGEHDAGAIVLQSNQTLYIAEGAVIYGRILAEDAENIRILGRGILDNSRVKEKILFEANAEDNDEEIRNSVRPHAVQLEFCKNVEIDGVTVRDSLCFTIRPLACRNLHINRVKIIGNWRYNSDGIDLCNCENALIENCFVRTYDDSICMKGFDCWFGGEAERAEKAAKRADRMNYELFRHIRVRNCTIWNDWGKALEIGAETRAGEITDIVFENCDIIHVTGAVLDCMNVDYADVHDITYRNINVEFDDVIPQMKIQKSDGEIYEQDDPDYTPRLICAIVMKHHEYSAGGTRRGRNRDITFRDIRVWGRQKPRFRFEGYDAEHQTRDITVENVWWNGELLTGFPEEPEMKTNEFTSNIVCKNDYAALGKNTVAAQDQLKESDLVRFENPAGSGKRVLFAGNSITLHGIKPDIGWYTEWGMAASAKERDYVHLLMKKIRATDPDAAFCICQVAGWERQYKNGEATFPLFAPARAFGADLIVLRLVENCSHRDFEPETFKKELRSLVRYLDPAGTAKVIVTTGFWRHPGDQALTEFAAENGWPCVSLGDLGERDEMKAIGLFAHEGVANHPGDRGMEAIAERIFAAVEK